MNNSKLAIESINLSQEEAVDASPMYRMRETEVLAIIEALENVSSSKYWHLLQEKVFDGVVESLQRRLRNEKDTTEMFRLQGQVVWAEKYSDLKSLIIVYKNELANIRNNLKNK